LILSKFLNVLCFEEMVAELKEKVETIKWGLGPSGGVD
jgi:hypothetical protein